MPDPEEQKSLYSQGQLTPFGRLFSGLGPLGTGLYPKPAGAARKTPIGDLADQIIKDAESRGISISPKGRIGLINALLDARAAGATDSQILKDLKNTDNLRSEIEEGLKASSGEVTTAGRLTPMSPEEASTLSEQDKRMLQAGFAPTARGNGRYINQAGDIYDSATDELVRAPAAARSASADAADWSQAALYQAQADILRRKYELAGTPVPGQPGFIYDGDGNPIDATFNNKQKAEQQAALALQELEARAAELGVTKEYNQGRLANEEEGNRLRGVEAEQQGRYQQGQLANELARLSQEGLFQQGQLAQGEKRLSLDTAAQAADMAAKAQQNDLARQQYISKVLSSPSDFIARAFSQRGAAPPQAAITQADLINQINQEFAKNPVTFAAPLQNSGANLVQQPRLEQPKAYAEGTPAPSASAPAQIDPETKRLQSRVDSVGKLLQYVESPDTQHRLVDELAEAKQRLGAGQHGMVNDKAAIVGDPQVPGEPNPEMVLNPTGAPISVVPMNKMGGRLNQYAFGTPTPPRLSPTTQYAGNYAWDPNANYGPRPLTDFVPAYQNRPPTRPTTSTLSTSRLAPPSSTKAPDLSGLIRLKSGNAFVAPEGFDSTYWTQRGAGFGGGNGAAALSGGGLPGTVYIGNQNTQGLQDMVNASGGYDTESKTYGDYLALQEKRAIEAQAPKPLTQEELVAKAEANLPPALRQLFGSQVGAKPMGTTGGSLNPQNPTGINPLKFGFNLLSPQHLSQLTSAELEALNSYLGVKYNTSLDDVGTGIQQTFGRQQGRAGRLRL